MPTKEIPEFSELIHSARERKGYSLRALESAVEAQGGQKVSRTLISFLEKGRQKPTYQVAYALARALMIDPETALLSALQSRIRSDQKRESEELLLFAQEYKLDKVKLSRELQWRLPHL